MNTEAANDRRKSLSPENLKPSPNAAPACDLGAVLVQILHTVIRSEALGLVEVNRIWD